MQLIKPIWLKQPVRGAKIDVSHPLAKSLVACYLLNEGSGGVIADISGNRNNGTLQSTTSWSTEGLDFNGSSDYVEIPDQDYLTFNEGGQDQPFSIMVKATCDDATSARWVAKRGNTWSNREYFLSTGASDQIQCSCYDADSNRRIGRAGPSNGMTDGETATVVMTYDGSEVEGGIKLYKNGYQHDSASNSIGSGYNGMDDTDRAIRIGADENSTYNDGKIYFVYIFNKELSADEVLNLYINPYQFIKSSRIISVTTTITNKLAPRPANVKPVRGAKLNKNHPLARGLVGIWLLNEGTGNTLFDHTGNGYNASLSGFGDLPSWGLALNSPIGIDYTGNSQESWQYEITGLSDYLNDKSECTIFVAGLGYNLYNDCGLIVGAQGGLLGDVIVEEWYDGFCYFSCHETVGTGSFPYYDQNDGYLGSSSRYFPHMNVLVYNGNLSGTNRIKGYINAIERSLNNLNTPPATLNLADSDALFCIGGFSNDVFVTRGHIVYAGVYERALTAEEIKELYINPYEMFYPI